MKAKWTIRVKKTTDGPCHKQGKLLDSTKCGKTVYQCDLLKLPCSPQKGVVENHCGSCPSYIQRGWQGFTPAAQPDTILPFFDHNPDWMDAPPRKAAGFWDWLNVKQAFIDAWPQWMADTPKMPDFRRLMFEDHGVVMIGGGPRYEIGLFVACSMLRRRGYTGSIMLWHRGALEPINKDLFYPLGVTIIDALAYRDQSERTKCRRWGFNKWDAFDNRWGGWGLKSYAVLHSPFKKVFYQDADWYLTAKSEALMECFRLAGDHGSVIWYDTNNGGQDTTVKWDVHGLPRDRAGMGFQGGQWLVNKEHPGTWQALNLYRKLDDYSDYYYRHHYGDQDSMRLAWGMVGQDYYAFDRRCIVTDGGMLAPFTHRTLGVHRIHDKTFLKEIDRLPQERLAQKYAADYRRGVRS